MLKKNFIIVIILLLTAACATIGNQNPVSLEAQAYNTMNTMAILFNSVWEAFVELREAGLISREDFNNGFKMATDFYNSYEETLDIIILYKQGVASADKVTTALGLLEKSNEALMKYLEKKIKEAKRT